MQKNQPFYITTAVCYPNGEPHMGHAYEIVLADTLARYHRAFGENVRLTTGIDDHGQKMVQTAAKMGMTPENLGNKMSSKFFEMCQALHISYDDFIRTKEPRNYLAAQALWQKLEDNGDIYLGNYSGWYSMRDESFYSKEEVTLTSEGMRIGPMGTSVEWVDEESYFFRLSKYKEKLLKLYEETPLFVQPASRFNEVKSFIKTNSLKDLCISRTKITWGVPVPSHPGHVMYVWIDALANYIASIGYPNTNEKLFQTFWPADVHIVGKDIIRFHAIIWPALLMSAELEIPRTISGHGFLFYKDAKMSKSSGNIISPLSLIDKFGVDGMRYFFTKEIIYGEDGKYSEDLVRRCINSDLANNFGNLVQRSLSMIVSEFDGVIPIFSSLNSNENDLLNMIKKSSILERVYAFIYKCDIHMVIKLIMNIVEEANRYLSFQAPWKLKKTDRKRMENVLCITVEAIRCCAILLAPVMPSSMNKVLDMLSMPEYARSISSIYDHDKKLPQKTKIQSPYPIFPKIQK